MSTRAPSCSSACQISSEYYNQSVKVTHTPNNSTVMVLQLTEGQHRRYGWATIVKLVDVALANEWLFIGPTDGVVLAKRSLALRWPSCQLRKSILGAYAKISVGMGQLPSLPISVLFSSLPASLHTSSLWLPIPHSIPSSTAATHCEKQCGPRSHV